MAKRYSFSRYLDLYHDKGSLLKGHSTKPASREVVYVRSDAQWDSALPNNRDAPVRSMDEWVQLRQGTAVRDSGVTEVQGTQELARGGADGSAVQTQASVSLRCEAVGDVNPAGPTFDLCTAKTRCSEELWARGQWCGDSSCAYFEYERRP